MSGLTPTGFVAATTGQILKATATDLLSTVDPGLDLSPEQPMGQVIGIDASDKGDLWALVAEVYGAIDPATAEGQALDVCCALTGTTRKPATSTTVQLTMNGSGGPYAGATLDKNGNVVTPGAVLVQVAGHPEFVFTNTKTFTLTGVALNVIFVCLRTGAIPANSGTVTVISPSVGGISSASNATGGAVGSDIETDAALRIRREAELVPPDGATNDSMRETLLAVKGTGPGFQGVISAFVFENDTNTTDGNGLPPHSTMAVVWDGVAPQAANNDIAQAIWNSKASGIQAYDGATGNSGVAIDSAGTTHTVPFARAAQLSMWINITVAVDSSFDATNGPAAIQALLATYGNTLVQGQKVVVSEFIAQALAIAGVRDVTVFQIDSHSSPTNTANIAVPITSIARFDTVRIIVSTTPFT